MSGEMASWGAFAEAAPAMAEAGRKLLYQFGPGLGYLGTVRADGGPRMHPICPLVVNGRLYAFIGRSPKLRDLMRDGRYALHSFPAPEVDDEFYVTGHALRNDDAGARAAVSAAVQAQGTSHGADDVLFELRIERAMLASYPPPGRGPTAWPPAYTTWQAGVAAAP